MASDNKLLDKLLERQAKLAEEIKKAKAAQAKKEAAIYGDKCRALGAAVLAEMESNEALKQTINPIIEKHTKIARDRKLLGLKPFPKPQKEQK